MCCARWVPGYLFITIELQWYAAKTAPGVTRLVMDGSTPARVPDQVIEELRGREKNGVIERPGARVRVTGGPFRGHMGLCAGMPPRERVTVLLSLLGGQQRVSLPERDVEPISRG